jgi:plasmid stabilization system protein ParE
MDDSYSRYIVIETERSEIDRDNAYLFLLSRNGTEYAHKWLTGLVNAIANIAEFPGPLANAIDEAASSRHQVEVRRLLYHGPGGRSSKTIYRILYTVIPSRTPEAEGIVQILRLLHTAQGLDDFENSGL